MNWVDWVIIITLLAFAWKGWRTPFFFEVFGLFGFVLSFLSSLRFYNFLAHLIQQSFLLPHSLANVLGFIVAWYFIEIVLFIFTKTLFKSALDQKHFSGDQFLAVIPALLKGAIFVSVILMLINAFPVGPTLKQSINSSKLGSLVLTNTYQIETPLKTAFGGLANDTLSFLTIEPKTNERLKLGFKNKIFTFNEELELKMINLVNEERVKVGVPPLTSDPSLRDVARDHSADMFLQGYFAHFSPEGLNVADRADKLDISYQVIGENLAYAPSVELAHNGLMNSPGHKANILSSDYHSVGIGIADGDENGIMITQVFKN